MVACQEGVFSSLLPLWEKGSLIFSSKFSHLVDWCPYSVLIRFGLAGSTASVEEDVRLSAYASENGKGAYMTELQDSFGNTRLKPPKATARGSRSRGRSAGVVGALGPVQNGGNQLEPADRPSEPGSVSRHWQALRLAPMTPRGMAARAAAAGRIPDRAVLHRFAIRAM